MKQKRWLIGLTLFALLVVGPVLASGCDEDYFYDYGYGFLPTIGGYGGSGGFTDVFFGFDDDFDDFDFDDDYFDDYDDYDDDFYFDGGFDFFY